MSKNYGILLISHVKEIAEGLAMLLDQIAADVTIVAVGGTDEGEIGTSFERISAGIASFEESTILAFYDLGSAKMNLELAMEMTEKEVILNETAFIEGAYTAASLVQVDVDLSAINEQLTPLIIK
ncbi:MULTISPECIES: dihydroxyacetone kinase phosphoryl donor subunit DhaM [unclassified Jeotgalibaca]|uniref:dihydroxyacetone kinase phosphoryl donor subunit DhaM n=1 Tax=unclassified Jeotgalibaca TaxID=2621505 RepID=UPI003FD659CE